MTNLSKDVLTVIAKNFLKEKDLASFCQVSTLFNEVGKLFRLQLTLERMGQNVFNFWYQAYQAILKTPRGDDDMEINGNDIIEYPYINPDGDMQLKSIPLNGDNDDLVATAHNHFKKIVKECDAFISANYQKDSDKRLAVQKLMQCVVTQMKACNIHINKKLALLKLNAMEIYMQYFTKVPQACPVYDKAQSYLYLDLSDNLIGAIPIIEAGHPINDFLKRMMSQENVSSSVLETQIDLLFKHSPYFIDLGDLVGIGGNDKSMRGDILTDKYVNQWALSKSEIEDWNGEDYKVFHPTQKCYWLPVLGAKITAEDKNNELCEILSDGICMRFYAYCLAYTDTYQEDLAYGISNPVIENFMKLVKTTFESLTKWGIKKEVVDQLWVDFEQRAKAYQDEFPFKCFKIKAEHIKSPSL